MWLSLLQQIQDGNIKAIARSISMVENECEGYEEFLASLKFNNSAKIIGITGAPGAGKSTITDGLIKLLVEKNMKVAVLCIDPSSPFHSGAVLGDRIRMQEWYLHPQVFIRSLATRGALGGLHPKIIEISEILEAAEFQYIIIETVGVGQSEIEIAGLADTTVVVMVPESGDEIQTMKAGLMEIADIFVVNKTDRPGADTFVKNLRLMLAPAFSRHTEEIPILKTVATNQTGLSELLQKIEERKEVINNNEKRSWLIAERAYYLIQQKRMKDVDKKQLKNSIGKQIENKEFNLYSFVKGFFTDQII